jgi:hypothetical protein
MGNLSVVSNWRETGMKNRREYKLGILVLLFFTLFLVFISEDCKKRGITTEIIDGVKHVHNPAEPLKGTIDLEVEETLRIDLADQQAEDLFVFLRFWKGPRGNVYLYDWTKKRVQVFDAEGEYLGAFGRIGQGPGEFPQYSSFSLSFTKEGEIWAIGGGKIARFDMERNFLGEIKPFVGHSSTMFLDEERYLAERSHWEGEGRDSHRWTIISYMDRRLKDPDKILFDYQKAKDVGMIQKGNSAFSDYWATPNLYWFYDGYKKRVFTVLNTEYKISAHDLSGENFFVFDKAHKNVSPSPEELEAFLKEDRKNAWKLIFDLYPDELCAIRNIKCLPKGYVAVYVITGLGTFNIDVYDPEGRFLYVLNPPQGISLEHAEFSDFGLALREEKEDRDVYVEYRVKNLPEIFGDR